MIYNYDMDNPGRRAITGFNHLENKQIFRWKLDQERGLGNVDRQGRSYFCPGLALSALDLEEVSGYILRC